MTLNSLSRVAVGAGLLVSGWTNADCVRLVAVNDSAQPNHFTLDFGQFGGPRTANITSSEMVLDVCDGATPSVSFVDYYQLVEPLILPDGTSTGNMIIRVPISAGTGYDANTGVFTTLDDYAIFFDGDLSAYQIQSPFGFQQQDSTGTIIYDMPTEGRISMTWEGQSALPNPFEPGTFIPFAYTCAVNARFSTASGCGTTGGCSGDLDGDCSTGLSDLTVMLANFGSTGGAVRPAQGDTDGDLDIDLADLAGLLGQFGADCN